MASPTAAKPLPARSVPASVMRMIPPRVAKAKSANGSNNGSSGLASPTSQAQVPTSSEFSVTLNLSGGRGLGADVDYPDGKTLVIKSVQPGGTLADWNSKHDTDGRAVMAGDRIVAINGVTGHSGMMIGECRSSQKLELVIRTKRRIKSASDFDSTGKRARTGDGAFSLYGGMPEPDPENDKTAVNRARETDVFSTPAVPENPKLVIFLDIDGVLRKLDDAIAVDGEVLPLHVQSRAFAPEATRALRFIVHKTGAGLVLSSEWRRSATLKEEAATALRAIGLPPMRGSTSVLEARDDVRVGTPQNPDREGTRFLRWVERRAREISKWLAEHPEVERWILIDDVDVGKADEVRMPDTWRMGRRLVRTAGKEGLTMSDARKAVEKLVPQTPAPSS